MRLVKSSDQAPMGVGSHFMYRRKGFVHGKMMKIVYAPEPAHTASEGKVTCEFPDGSQSEYYASVWGLEWIEREDRQLQDEAEAFNNEPEGKHDD